MLGMTCEAHRKSTATCYHTQNTNFFANPPIHSHKHKSIKTLDENISIVKNTYGFF